MTPEEYKQHLHEESLRLYAIAQQARKHGYDPATSVEVQLAKNMAERVVGLVSVAAPQIVGAGIAERIVELENQYGTLDWRVSLQIALEVAEQRFCAFKDQVEAMEVGIRIGFAYATVGVVSSPLEGFVNIELKDRLDNRGKYFCLNFAGPIRNAGGTAAAQCAIIADYVRVKMGYDVYDPTDDEVNRCAIEIEDYHERVTILQYKPSKEESEFLMRHLPVEISGDASERMDVSNYKNLPRIPTNKIRSGYCLLHSSCIPLKAPKLWKQLGKWGKDFGMEHWGFLEDFVKLQKKMQAGKSAKSSGDGAKITPNYTYVADLVAGRPVFGHPLRPGAFRLRYGRARTTGLSAQAVHPATMHVLRNFIASGTQLKVERPGKAAAFGVCDAIDGPIVKLVNGTVLRLDTEEEARAVRKDIQSILYAGDVLVCYGDFSNRNHVLCPAGYCEEWWVQELETAINTSGTPTEVWSERIGTDLAALIAQPFQDVPFGIAMHITDALAVPLHPRYTYYWSVIAREQLVTLVSSLRLANLATSGNRLERLILPKGPVKQVLEEIGIPHVATPDNIVLTETAMPLLYQLGIATNQDIETLLETIANAPPERTVLAILAERVPLRDKAGTFIGTRMGRPEKAKMRSLSSSPHGLFPVGDQGGRLRSVQSALEKGFIMTDTTLYVCPSCGREGIHARCTCGSLANQAFWHPQAGTLRTLPDNPPKELQTWKKQRILPREYLDQCLRMLKTAVYPDLIKGVRGLSGRDHHAEHLIKAFLRAKHDLAVNKDGTVRYDASETPLTHFKPAEVGTSVERLVALGYTHDIVGEALTRDDQVLQLRPQDVVLPSCPDSPDERCDDVLFRVTRFVDDLLVAYGERPFYNCRTREDLAGHLIVGLAPHTSAGTVGRIVGFSKTQGMLCHPYFHCAMRRDCFTYDTVVPIKHEGVWSMKPLGDIVEDLAPSRIVDVYGTLETRPRGYTTMGIRDGMLTEVPVTAFTKHAPQPIIELRTALGRSIATTESHKHIILRNGVECVVFARDLLEGDTLKLPYALSTREHDVTVIDIIDELADRPWLMVRGLRSLVPDLRGALLAEGCPRNHVANYVSRDSVPVTFARSLIARFRVEKRLLTVSAKRDTVTFPALIDVTDDFLALVGLYVAEGYARNQVGTKGSYQVYVAASKPAIRSFVRTTMARFGLVPSERKTDRVTYSSRILYELFSTVLGCGSDAYTKRIPARFLALPPARAGKFLDGYLEGDGSVSTTDLRIVFDTVSEGLRQDMAFLLARFGIFVKYVTTTRKPGKTVAAFYQRKGRETPSFTCTRGTIQSKFVHSLARFVSFLSDEKRSRLASIVRRKRFRNLFVRYDETFFYDTVVSIGRRAKEPSYCLSVPNNTVIANGILTRQCDGDESCVFLLVDAFLNFSKAFLPTSRGGTMDAPLVLTTILNPAEVDDMAFDMDIVARYPKELYEAALEYKNPSEVKIAQVKKIVGTPDEDMAIAYTHPVSDINAGVLCSSYKTLPSMQDKLQAQMKLAEELRCVDERDVARLVIEKHFIRDVKGNLRKFSTQQFRCMNCNEKYRRPPITRNGACSACGGKVGFTISEGSVVKYLEPMESLARGYNVHPYLMQTIDLTRRRVEEVFGKDSESQTGLGAWFG